MKNVTFEHVKGVEEAKNELQEVVEFLRNPQKFTALGGKLPKGVCSLLNTYADGTYCLFVVHGVCKLCCVGMMRSDLTFPSQGFC